MLKAEIQLIEDQKSLIELSEHLSKLEEFAFDTEYDSFKRTYGFTILLMQFFDGEKVFIVDPLQVSDLSVLWPAFETRDICKVVYSGSEDIALLKQLGCNTHNIYDVQIAATLCNHEARNLGDLIGAETQHSADKEHQTSDWQKRPLTPGQIEYAANDVIHLLSMQKSLTERVKKRELHAVLEEENAAMELIQEREHVPRLKPYHYKNHSQSFCNALLGMIELRDEIAKEMNRPPVQVVDTKYLEEALIHKERFLSSREFKGFHPRIRGSESISKKFIRFIESYDPLDLSRARKPDNGEPKNRRPVLSKEEQIEMISRLYDPVKSKFIGLYGERTSEFLLRGLKKIITNPEVTGADLRKYQQVYLREMREGTLA